MRRLVTWSRLSEVAAEEAEQEIDEAVQVILDGLKDSDLSHRLQAAATLLRHSPAARARGWGRGGRRLEDEFRGGVGCAAVGQRARVTLCKQIYRR